MIVHVVPGTDPPCARVEGIQSERALSVLIRAVIGWYAFGRCRHVIVDLTSFGDWSPRVMEDLATAGAAAADAGYWLAFFPVDPSWAHGARADRFHAYPDGEQARLAMRQAASGTSRHRSRGGRGFFARREPEPVPWSRGRPATAPDAPL